MVEFDYRLFLRVNDFAESTGWLHPFASVYANYGIVLFAALLIYGWWWARKSGDPGTIVKSLWAGIATLLAVGINQPVVAYFHRERPYDHFQNILVLAHRTTDPSFPSDHSTMAASAAVGLLILNRRLGVVAVVATLLMCLARVYIAAHFPGDVIAGVAEGAAVAFVGYFVVRRILETIVLRLMNTPLKPILAR